MILPGATLKPLLKLPKDPKGCWLWRGSFNTHGRPIKAVAARQVPAQRWLWQLLFGPIEKGFVISPSCGDPACVSPHHMRLMTQSEVQGDYSSPLTPGDLIDIRTLGNDGGVSHELLGPRFGVHPSTITRIANGTRRQKARSFG